MPSSLTDLTLTQASTRIHAGELSPVDLLAACRSRIDRLDDRLRAWVCFNENAEGEARALADELAAGKSRGPLHGIPIGVKDIFDVAGMPTTGGSRTFLQDYVPDEDAECIRRLREAGAIFIGKTATTEFACFDPAETRNPWKPRPDGPDHTPGGSSSGSAAGVAARMCLGALGSQTGGSVTRPAAYCGIVGIKPSYGRTSVRGVLPVSFSLDHPGVFARSVQDAALLCAGMWGPDPLDPFASGEPDPVLPDFPGGDPPRIGVLESFFFERADDTVEPVVRDALDVLEGAGASRATVGLPESFSLLGRAHGHIMAAEVSEVHAVNFRKNAEGFRPGIRSIIAQGLALPGVEYAAARRHQISFRNEMADCFRDVDILVTPATPTTAPAGLLSTGDPVFNSPWSHSGLPTVCLPCGLSSDGLPVSLQLIGGAFSEAPLFSAASWCESQLGWDARPSIDD